MTRRPRSCGRVREGDEIAEGAEARVDGVEVGDVVAVVAVGRRVERQQPDAGGAESLEMVEPVGEALEIADAVAVRIHEGLDIEAVDDGVLVPEIEHGSTNLSRCMRAARSRSGRRRSEPRVRLRAPRRHAAVGAPATQAESNRSEDAARCRAPRRRWHMLARARAEAAAARRDRRAARRTGSRRAAVQVRLSSARPKRGAPSCDRGGLARPSCRGSPGWSGRRPTSRAALRGRPARSPQRQARAAWIGGTGCSRRGKRLRAQSNCGVSTAGSCTIVSRIAAALVDAVRSAGNP